MPERLVARVNLTIISMAMAVGGLNFIVYLTVYKFAILEAIAQPQVWVLLAIAGIFGSSRYAPSIWVKWLQVASILLLSGPLTLSSPFTFFGMWFFVLGLILLYKYSLLNRYALVIVLVVSLYFVPFLVISIARNEGTSASVLRALNYLIFLASCLAFLYFIFEEEIRDLLASNRTKESVLAAKESELAVQAAEIARLEPLSELGERVAHVAHSFKNQLNQISTVVFFLEQLHDEKRAVDKLQEFTQTVNERIENILMISRAGVDLEPEEFDVARLLEGLRQVYLTERSFSENAATELTVEGPLMLHTVRWDFILMVENILKNAVEAIADRGVRGTIRIDLSGGKLTLANDGGAMAICGDCAGDCLSCRRYGHPGQTTKKGGSGHGLAQVFGTCRRNGWGLRLRTSGVWTMIEITLASPAA